MTSSMEGFNLFLSFVLPHTTWLNFLGNTRSCEQNAQRSCMNVSNHKSVGNFRISINILPMSKKLVVAKYANLTNRSNQK